MFVFYGVKPREEIEIFKNKYKYKYNFYCYYEENRKSYLRYGIIDPEFQTMGFSSKAKTIGFYIDKDIYVKSKGMECIDFEDFIRFIK